MRNLFTLIAFTLVVGALFGQAADFSYDKSAIQVSNPPVIIKTADIKYDWRPHLVNLEMPSPGGKSYKSFLLRQKQLLKENRNVSRKAEGGLIEFGEAPNPILESAFEGNQFDFSVPNDNDLAISNEGMLISVINSNIIFYDTETDSLYQTISLEAFFDTLHLPANKYDPRVLYDPKLDKFIIISLSGNTDSTSNVVLAFSQTNNPMDEWYLYALPGSPLNDSTWSDFPMVALTDDELILTVNALVNDTINTSDSWKYLFKESVIWQITKRNGFEGKRLETRFYNNILFGGKSIRNLCPIQGGSTTYGPNIFLLSNRNFDLQNDSIFIVELTGGLHDENTTLKGEVRKTNVPYGLPPDAEQINNLTLQTNDARILDGFIEAGKIHFVQNTVNPDTLRSAIYHGIITDLYGAKNIEGAIIGQDELDFGYPNISYTGSSSFDEQVLITFNHTSADSFAGFSGIYYNATSGYSDRITIKAGQSHINIISGNNERWGDYSGSQPKYNEPGKVWVAGFWGVRRTVPGTPLEQSINATWIAKLSSPDTSYPVSVSGGINRDLPAKAYPNPAEDVLVLEFELEKPEFIDISLYDISGKLIKTFIRDRAKDGRNLFTFSLSPLQHGTYLLTIRDKEGLIKTKRIIKQ